MNSQEIFNTVATHLFTQGKQARTHPYHGRCAYRTDEGLTCAVGCLIQDYYEPEMDILENADIQSIYNVFNDKLPEWIGENIKLLMFLQTVHDSCKSWTSPDMMKKNLIIGAKDFALDYSILDKFERFGA